MLAKRVIAHLGVKAPNVVKGIMLEGLRVMGDPAVLADRYYHQGIDEIIFQDVVASLYGRNGLVELVRRASENSFVPLAVGGGLRSVEDMHLMFMAGADKVCVNTAAVKRPLLLSEGAKRFGCQAIVCAIEYIDGKAMTDNGREATGLDAFDWARKAVDYGAGEILLTSIARDGGKKGYDCEFIAKVAHAVGVPVIAHGGAWTPEHLGEAVKAGADGCAVASALHYGKHTVRELKEGINGNAIRAA